MQQRDILSSMTFRWLCMNDHCSEETVQVLESLGLEHLTYIQAASICKLIKKKNLIIEAPTGTGKTLAYLIPAIERLKSMQFTAEFGVGCLMIFPTRELCYQTARVLDPFVKKHGFNSCIITGGGKLKHPAEQGVLQATFIAATPGRLLDVMSDTQKYGNWNCKHLKILIIDEADALLRPDFLKDLKKIVGYLPLSEKLQIVLATATATSASKLAVESLFTNSFEFVSVNNKRPCPDQENRNVKQRKVKEIELPSKERYVHINAQERFFALVELLKEISGGKVLVFFATRHSTKFYFQMLQALQFNVQAIMGSMNQSLRLSRFSNFLEAKHGILLATGVADRGWDIPGITHVIQFDPPAHPELYVHRYGRSGRGVEHQGESILFLWGKQLQFLHSLEKQGVHLEQLQITITEETRQKVMQAFQQDFHIQAARGFRSYLRTYVRGFPCFRMTKEDCEHVRCSFFFQETVSLEKSLATSIRKLCLLAKDS